jgi:hypothetical protein
MGRGLSAKSSTLVNFVHTLTDGFTPQTTNRAHEQGSHAARRRAQGELDLTDLPPARHPRPCPLSRRLHLYDGSRFRGIALPDDEIAACGLFLSAHHLPYRSDGIDDAGARRIGHERRERFQCPFAIWLIRERDRADALLDSAYPRFL